MLPGVNQGARQFRNATIRYRAAELSHHGGEAEDTDQQMAITAAATSVTVTDNTVDNEFGEEDFDAAEYVHLKLGEIRSGDEVRQLQTLRNRLNVISAHSSESLKKSVFTNYQKFIDTAKEVSHLEREIYALSALLAEQKALLENAMQLSAVGESQFHSNDANMISLQRADGASSLGSPSMSSTSLNALAQKMGALAGILNSSNERVLFHDEVIQLDSDSMRQLHPAMLILLSDRLLIGHPSSGKHRFQLESTHSLNNLAAVNIKDREGGDAVSSAFKLLIFPEQRVFLAKNARSKKEWLDAIENAKRQLLHESSLVRQATIRGRRRQELPLKLESQSDNSLLIPIVESKSPDETAWLSELPAELDDCIAHRDMDHAVELILEWKSCLSRDLAIDSQLGLRENQILQLLSEEVRRPGALHGGPRAVRKAISLLSSLDRAPQAIDLYLRKRSTVLHANTKELTMSEEPLSYVRQLSKQFLDAISDVVTEFASQPEYFSMILQWCSSELSVMLSLIRRHVIEVAPTMAVLAHTWRILMTHCDSLITIGLELSFEVHRLLAPSLKLAMETNFKNIIESMRLRISEERWRAYNMESESNVNRFLEEMSDMGLAIDWALSPTHRSSIFITQNACHFSRVTYSLVRNLAILRSSLLKTITDAFIVQLWSEYLEHLSNAPKSAIQQYTTTFVVSQLLPLCDHIYDERTPGILSNLLATKFESLLIYKAEQNGQDESSDEEVVHI